jgi:hypothetical protein
MDIYMNAVRVYYRAIMTKNTAGVADQTGFPDCSLPT